MAIVVLLVVGLVVSGYVGYRLFTEEPDRDPPSSRVTGTTDDGWQQVSYRGVTVEVPPAWERLDTTICDVDRRALGAPPARSSATATPGCRSSTRTPSMPATGPGVHTAPASDTLPDGGWTGYVTRGDVVVNVTDVDEVVVRRVLQSVSQVI